MAAVKKVRYAPLGSNRSWPVLIVILLKVLC